MCVTALAAPGVHSLFFLRKRMLALLLFFASIVVLGGAAIAALLRFSQAGAGGGAQVRERRRERRRRERAYWQRSKSGLGGSYAKNLEGWFSPDFGNAILPVPVVIEYKAKSLVIPQREHKCDMPTGTGPTTGTGRSYRQAH